MPEDITRAEVMFPQPKKRTRRSEVDCEKEFLMENDKDTRVGESLGEERSECLRAGGEVQVDPPL